MVTTKVYTVFSELPEGIQNFLLNEADKVFNDLIDDHKLPEDGFFEGVNAPILDAVMGVIRLDQSLTKIGIFLKSSIAEEKLRKEVLVKLLSGVFWPMRDFLGKELTDFLSQQKIDTAGWPPRHVLFKPLSYQGAVSEEDNNKEDEQIATIKAGLPPPPKALTELDKDSAAIYDKIPDKPGDPYLQNRLRNVISSRLRDVRSASELLSLLQRDSKVGGLGLEREPAEIWAKLIEDAYGAFHAQIEGEEKHKLEVQLVEQKQKIEERRQREAAEHAKWYDEKIKKRQSAETERQQLAVALKKGLESRAVHPLDIQDAALEKKQFGELVAAPNPITHPSPPLPREGESRPASGGTERGRVVAPTVRVSVATAAMAQEAKSASVDGVKPVATLKLHGLVQELANMTLSSFRRLDKRPQEAISKIKQRLETLGEEAFDQKVIGIRAWQVSPLMKTYMTLVTESFKAGKPIAELVEARRQAGEDVLTRDEIEALIDLNNGLHF